MIPMLGSPRREVDKRAFDAVRRELGFSLVRCAGHSPEGWEIEYQSPEGTLKMATLAGRIELRQGALIAALTRLDNDALGRVQERWEVRAGEVVEATEEPATDLHLLKAVVRTHPHVRQLLATGFCGRPGYPEEPQDLVGAHFAILANARPKAFPSVGIQSEGMFLGCESDDHVGLLRFRLPPAVRHLERNLVDWRLSTDGRIAVPGCWFVRRFFPAELAFGDFPTGWPVQ